MRVSFGLERRLGSLALASIAFIPALSQALPVINEVHYHPLHAETSPEPLTQEWVEVHNPDAAAVDVGGWAITKGVDFVIPAGTTIPADGYLVIAADVAGFQAAHPGFAGLLRGGWTGQLSNTGESIKLEDASGSEVDTVDYADEGDWAVRGRGAVVSTWLGHQGWDWFTDADGLGRTKELINPALKKNSGQNWKDSVAMGGSPGAANGSLLANMAPVILDGKHRPQIPRSTEAVTVSAKITDDNGAPTTASLRWRLDGAATFSTVTMSDPDLDGEWTATIPAQANLAIVEWYIQASDGTLTRTWPPAARTSNPGVVPETFAQSCNALYQVDNNYDGSVGWTAGSMPVYRLIMTATERTELRTIQEGQDNQNIQIDAAMNATFIATDGTGQDSRYRCSVRNRGFSSRTGPPSHFSLSLVSGEEWAGRQSFQLNCRYPHAAICAAAIFQLGGMAVQEAAAAQLRVNGLNPAVSSQGVGTFTQTITNGALARTEALGGDWASNHFPNDDAGNLYRVDDHDTGTSAASNRFQYPGNATPTSYQDIYRKQTNADLNDFSDLAGLFQSLNDAASSSAVFAANLRAKANVDQWLTYIALDSLVGNMEGGLTTGRTDDFSMYRGLTDQRFVLVPHDFDTTLGQNTPNGLTRSIFSHVPNLTGLVRMFNEPEFVHIYYKKTVELCNTVFNNARLDPLFEEILGNWPAQSGSPAIAATPITTMKSWVTQRRTNVLNQIPQVNSFDTSAGVTTTNATLIDGMKQTPDGAATFSGNFNVAAVQSIYLNGQPATLNWRTSAGTWTYAATTANGFLKKGPNRVNIAYYSGMNGTGSVVFTATVDIYNAVGTPTTVAADGTTGAVAPGNIVLTAPASYVAGIPFLVGVEYRTSANLTDMTKWDRTVSLAATNGVTLRPAGGTGAATVIMYNGRGSALVEAVGVSTGTPMVLLPGRNTTGSVTTAGTTPPNWDYYTGVAAPVANWQNAATTLTGWTSGPPIFFRSEAGLAGQGTDLTAANANAWAMRTNFTVTNPSQFASAKVRVQRDDGVIIYFNGSFLNLSTGMTQGMSWTTLSTAAIATASEADWVEFDLPVNLINNGTNTIGIEVRNNNQSNDMRMNCEIVGYLPGAPTDPGNFTITASVDGLTNAKALTSLGFTPTMTNKSGVLPGSETWSGVINVTGDVTVPVGATLTISPGTHVLLAGSPFGTPMGGGADLFVMGTLSVGGTAVSPVSITCSNSANRWGRFYPVQGGVAQLNNCLMSRGGHYDAAGYDIREMIWLDDGTDTTLNDCIVSDTPGFAVMQTDYPKFTANRTIFSRCGGGVAVGGGDAQLTDCLVSDIQTSYREGASAVWTPFGVLLEGEGHNFLTRTTVANVGDDAVQVSAGFAPIPPAITECVLRNAADKGVDASVIHLAISRTQIVDCDVGFAAKNFPGADPRQVALTNVTIVPTANNSNTQSPLHGVGVYNTNVGGSPTTTYTFTHRNCLLSAAIPMASDYGVVGNLLPEADVAYSCLFDAGGAVDPVPSGSGNITTNPLFTNGASRDFSLQSVSPCINTGDPAMTDPDNSRVDMGALPYGFSNSPGSIIWTLANSPYTVPQTVNIAAGTTLTIEPGVNVYFAQGTRMFVRGRIQALGTANNHIRFSHIPGTSVGTDVDPIKNGTQTGNPKWGGIRVYDSLAQENQFRYCDFVNAQGTSPTTDENYGSLGFIRSQGWADHLTFAGTHLRMLYGRNASLTVTHCTFPDMFIFDSGLGRVEIPTSDFLGTADNRMEPLKIEHPTTDTELAGQTGTNGAFPNGLPRNGHERIYYNDFHGNRGHQDVFDADSGRWDAPDANGNQANGQFMLDCRYNTFHGLTGDEHIDLGGDAFIASNRIYSGSKDQWTVDTGYSNAISSGDKGTGTTIVVARNVFYDLDHAINCKINTATIFEHNTCVDFHQDWQFNHTVTQEVRCAAVNLYVPSDGNAAGDGAYVAYNIFYGNSVAPDDTVSPDPIGGFPRIFSWPDQTTTGATTSFLRVENNFVDDRILDTSLGANHAGGLFAPAWGTGNVQGNPLFSDKATKDFSLQPNSPAKGMAAGGLDYGATVNEWCYLLNVPAAETSETSTNITVGGPGIVAYKWRLDGGAWSSRIQIGTGGVLPRSGTIVRQGTIALTGLSTGPHTLEVLGQDMAGNWQDADPAKTIEGLAQVGPTTATWTVYTGQQVWRLNEVAANTADGIDWIELRNVTSFAVPPDGFVIADNADGIDGVQLSGFPAVPPGGLIAINATQLGFGFDKDGDGVFLIENNVVRDSITFGPQPLGYTIGRIHDSGAWTLCTPTKAAANVSAALATSTSTLRITEAFASAVISYKDDWVEITNSGALPVDLSGLILTDNRIGTAGSVIPPLSFVSANSAVVFMADNTEPPAGNHLNFSLDAQQENLALLTTSGVVLDEIVLYPQTDDWAQTRLVTGGTGWGELATRGFTMLTTDSAYMNALAMYRGLRITEIMYNAQGGSNFDWIELRNVGTTAFDLSGAAFVQGIDYVFGNVTLNPGQYIVIAKSLASFQGRYGTAANVVGPYDGNLDNGGETLALQLPAPFDENVLCFAYGDAWWPNTDGGGRSLTLISNTTNRQDFGESTMWTESASLGGSPDGIIIPTPTAYAPWLSYFTTVDGADADNDGLSSLVEFGLGIDPQRGGGSNGIASAPVGMISGDDRIHLSFALPENAARPGGYGQNEVTYFVEVSTSLESGAWAVISTKTPAAGWTGVATVTAGAAVNGFVPVIVTDPATHTSQQRRFIRLRMEWTP